MSAKEQNAEALVDWITTRYVATEEDSTVKEIAHGMGWSESKVRRLLDNEPDVWCRLITTVDSRTSHSTNYLGFKTGMHHVRVWGPSRKELMARLRRLEAFVSRITNMDVRAVEGD